MRNLRNSFGITFIVLLFSCKLFGQIAPNDLNLLKQNFEKEYRYKRNVKLIKSRNILMFPMSASMFVYQKYISGQLGSACMYHPSCSEFSKQCIEKHGWVKGLALSADRLSRCTRLTQSDLNDGIEWDDDKVMDLPEYYK